MLEIERFAKMTPSVLKPFLGQIYRGFKGFYVGIRKRNVDVKSLDEILSYWRQPQDGHNLPTDYLNNPKAHIRSQNLLKVLKKYASCDERILEPGCNVGRNLNYLFESGFTNLEGIELNEDALELPKKSYPEMARQITIHNRSIEEIIGSFKDNAFDIVYTMAVLQHIHPASEWVFSEIVRITKSFLITMEGEDYVSWRHFPRNYKKIFESCGMKQLEVYNSFRVFQKR